MASFSLSKLYIAIKQTLKFYESSRVSNKSALQITSFVVFALLKKNVFPDLMLDDHNNQSMKLTGYVQVFFKK